jgi:LmbE family N-acetylglucosaminyl deacetylase
MNQKLFILLIYFFGLTPTINAQPQKHYSVEDIHHYIQKLGVSGSALYIAAHPDDENTRLLAHLAGEMKLRTAYISLTRGDGGQNLLGNEIGPLLGLIRSHELMAARAVDRADQFFSRAYDFGYSKSPEETFNIWNRDSVLADLVYIIRFYRPDVLITRFATDGSGGHGHHTASALLAEDAFKAAGDPKRFPEHLKTVKVWQPLRLVYNNAARFRNPDADMSGNIAMQVGNYNPVFGRSYGEISGLSRSMHKTQGFGSANFKGEVTEYFLPILGTAPKNDIFDEVDLTLKRIDGADELSIIVNELRQSKDLFTPSKLLPKLLNAYKAAEKIKDPFWRQLKQDEIETLIVACSGLWLELTSAEPLITQGDSISLSLFAINRSDVPIRLESFSFDGDTRVANKEMVNNKAVQEKFIYQIPYQNKIGGPYWLNNWPKDGLFQLNDIADLQKPVNEGHLYGTFKLNIDGNFIQIKRPLLYKWVDPTQGEQFRITEIIPPVMLAFPESVVVFNGENPVNVRVSVRSGNNTIAGDVRLKLPKGFVSTPASQPFTASRKNQEQILEFIITPPAKTTQSKFVFSAEAVVNDRLYDRGLKEIKYDHIPVQVLMPFASMNAVMLQTKPKTKALAYIQGAGDEVAKGLRQMGYNVTEINADQIDKTDLSQYSAIVLGVRAFNTSEKLVSNMDLLHKYVYQGGNLLVQYNTNSWAGPLKTEFGPYPMKIGRGRVTDEDAKVIFDEKDPLMNFPNKIIAADFEGWVQERGLYFANEWAKEYRTPLQMKDPGEDLQAGSLLIASYGKGQFIYTGLSFFRQIPDGVPGAYRLLSNLVEAGNQIP